jgi:hypothetical protein
VVRCTFSPPRAWRPAVGARLARTLGIRKATVRCSSRKCACRRESSSHEAAKPQMTDRRQAVTRGTQAAHGIQQPDFSQGRRERRPVQTHEDAALGGEMTQQPASSWQVSVQLNRRQLQPRPKHVSASRQLKSATQSSGPRCKAQSAMQSPWQAPQTRSTATALAVARSGTHNPSHTKSNSVRRQRALMPNPSLKRSTNGRPPGPGRRYAVHFRQPGPGVLPLAPA